MKGKPNTGTGTLGAPRIQLWFLYKDSSVNDFLGYPLIKVTTPIAFLINENSSKLRWRAAGSRVKSSGYSNRQHSSFSYSCEYCALFIVFWFCMNTVYNICKNILFISYPIFYMHALYNCCCVDYAA